MMVIYKMMIPIPLFNSLYYYDEAHVPRSQPPVPRSRIIKKIVRRMIIIVMIYLLGGMKPPPGKRGKESFP